MSEKLDVNVIPTLRDVAQAALEIDADGGREPVAWGRLIDRAKAMAAKRQDDERDEAGSHAVGPGREGAAQ